MVSGDNEELSNDRYIHICVCDNCIRSFYLNKYLYNHLSVGLCWKGKRTALTVSHCYILWQDPVLSRVWRKEKRRYTLSFRFSLQLEVSEPIIKLTEHCQLLDHFWFQTSRRLDILIIWAKMRLNKRLFD